MRIVVVGTGYVGLMQAAGLAKFGHNVVAVDVDAAKIERLQKGEVPFFEPGLPELVADGIKSSKLKFESSIQQAFKEKTEVVFICVGTPMADDGTADLKFVEAVARELGPLIASDVIVVTKSTVPPGTGKKIQAWLGHSDAQVVSNPEFLREGSAVHDFEHPDRIVLGTGSDRAREVLLDLYKNIDAPKLTMSIASAELAKYAANTMLANRLSLMNEIANIADAVGADVLEIESVLASDPRIGAKFLRSGAGFGGSCFPKDVLALEAAGREHGYASRLIEPIISVNKDQPGRFVDKIEKRLGGLKDKKLAVWGLAFNKNTDDVRESPAMRIVKLLVERGAKVTAHDPVAINNAKLEFGELVAFTSTKEEAIAGAEALLVLTEWPEYINADHKIKLIFDGKNCLPHASLVEAGIEVIGMGVWRKPSDYR